MLTTNQIEYIRGEISPTLLENTLAWVLNNCDIQSREDIPQIFGSPDGNPAQQVLVENLVEILKLT